MRDLRRRTLGQLIQNAVFSVPSGLVIALAIILVGLGIPIPVIGDWLGLSPAWWLVGLVPLWVVVVAIGLLNPRAGEHAASQAIRAQFDTSVLATAALRRSVEQAIRYREQIDAVVQRFGDSPMRVRVQDIADQVEDWLQRIYALALRLDAFNRDPLVHNDLRAVPDAIQKLKQRLAIERSPAIQTELQATIARREAQYDSLLRLRDTMARAELQLENTLTALGTIYSQVLLLSAREVDSGRAQQLRESISEQVQSLQDILESMEEVYHVDLPPALAQRTAQRR
ncbi:MAG: hypothetical protein RMM31_03915 [Anaerolineae bacterium]|nr:hypothetical protein [Thermoflexales bacterium]MDW8395370.1 hypothetical protein [Anaerolineae bacterium]